MGILVILLVLLLTLIIGVLKRTHVKKERRRGEVGEEVEVRWWLEERQCA